MQLEAGSSLSIENSRYDEKGRPWTRSNILNALKACIRCRDLKYGKTLHTVAFESGHVSNVKVASTLMDMYAKCGRMAEARLIFDSLQSRDIASWNVLISGYANNGETNLALDLFDRIAGEGHVLDSMSFVAALKACSKLAQREEGLDVGDNLVKLVALEKAMILHCKVVCAGFESDLYVSNTLVDLYSKCGSLGSAQKVFDGMRQPDAVSWNNLILGYTEDGKYEEALDLFYQFDGCSPEPVTFLAALKACCGIAEKEQAKQIRCELVKVRSLEMCMDIHRRATCVGLEWSTKVANTILAGYAKCGALGHAQKMFDGMPCRNLVSWNVLILGYASTSGHEVKAINLFNQMQHVFLPDSATFVAALKACAGLAEREEAKQIGPGRLVKLGTLEVGMNLHRVAAKIADCDLQTFVANSLADMYSKCSTMEFARKIFDGMQSRNLVLWNVLLLGYAENGEEEEALSLFQQMSLDGCAMNAMSLVAALKACSGLGEQEEAEQVDGKPVKVVSLEKGMRVHSMAAEKGYDQDVKVACTLVEMYANCGRTCDSKIVFDGMQQQDVVSWTSLILGYAENGEAQEALDLFQVMVSRCTPNSFTFVAALKACSIAGAFEEGKALHEGIRAQGLHINPIVATSLITFYAKCWKMDDALEVFDTLGPAKDLVAWTALIGGFGQHGDTSRVFHIFEEMKRQELRPNSVTFLCLLSACSHAGLLEKAQEYFEAMCSNYRIQPGIEHYTCMVDMLGRAGKLDEAMEVIKGMPVKPNKFTWTALLGACRKWGRVELAKVAFESLLSLDERNAAAYVMMAGIYRANGMFDEQAALETRRSRWDTR